MWVQLLIDLIWDLRVILEIRQIFISIGVIFIVIAIYRNPSSVFPVLRLMDGTRDEMPYAIQQLGVPREHMRGPESICEKDSNKCPRHHERYLQFQPQALCSNLRPNILKMKQT